MAGWGAAARFHDNTNAEHIDDKGEHRHKNAKHTYEVEHCFTNYKYSWRHMASIYNCTHITYMCVHRVLNTISNRGAQLRIAIILRLLNKYNWRAKCISTYFVVCSGFVVVWNTVCVCDVYLVWITAVVNLLLLQALDELMASRNWRIFLVFIQVENIFWLRLLRTPIILCWKQCCPLRPENVTVTKSAANRCLHDLRRRTGVVDICTLVLNLICLHFSSENQRLKVSAVLNNISYSLASYVHVLKFANIFVNTHFKQHYRSQSV